jgi:hypothetical protein
VDRILVAQPLVERVRIGEYVWLQRVWRLSEAVVVAVMSVQSEVR